MDPITIAVIWISIAVSLILLLKAQAQNLSLMKSELRANQDSLSTNAAQLAHLAGKLEDTGVLKASALIQISHELRTPLAAIKGAATAIQKYADKEPQSTASFSNTILRESERLGTMIESLLSVVAPSDPEQQA